MFVHMPSNFLLDVACYEFHLVGAEYFCISSNVLELAFGMKQLEPYKERPDQPLVWGSFYPILESLHSLELCSMPYGLRLPFGLWVAGSWFSLPSCLMEPFPRCVHGWVSNQTDARASPQLPGALLPRVCLLLARALPALL